GRMTALTAAGGAIFAGAADGGVWKSTDGGGDWTSWSAGLPRLSIGVLATNPADGSVWVGVGEANTAFEHFTGFGVYRLAAGAQRRGKRGTFRRATPAAHVDVDASRRASASAGAGVIVAIIGPPKRVAIPTAAEGFRRLQGIYVSKSGNPAGPWTLIADATTL